MVVISLAEPALLISDPEFAAFRARENFSAIRASRGMQGWCTLSIDEERA